MRIYVLDRQSVSCERMLTWLMEDERLTQAEVFEDYIELIERIWNFPPDFCLIRLGQEEIPGLKTAEMIRQISPRVRIIFISDDKDYALDAYELGVYGYLCPVSKDKLKKYLR